MLERYFPLLLIDAHHEPENTMRYCPLTLNAWTYHPETMRAARLLRYITAGFDLTRTYAEDVAQQV